MTAAVASDLTSSDVTRESFARDLKPMRGLQLLGSERRFVLSYARTAASCYNTGRCKPIAAGVNEIRSALELRDRARDRVSSRVDIMRRLCVEKSKASRISPQRPSLQSKPFHLAFCFPLRYPFPHKTSCTPSETSPARRRGPQRASPPKPSARNPPCSDKQLRSSQYGSSRCPSSQPLSMCQP